jgi:malonyl-CoA decarboxylase
MPPNSLLRLRGAFQRCFSTSATAAHNPLLSGLGASPDSALHAYLTAPSQQQVRSLEALHAAHPSGIQPALQHVAPSVHALPFLASVRAHTGQHLGTASWAKPVDSAALAVLRPLYSPAHTPLQQLALGSEQQPWMRSLLRSAQAQETVLPTTDPLEFERKFGWRRLVHALHHRAAPEDLLAVLYTALLPGMPASLAALDAQSGQPPPPSQAGSSSSSSSSTWTLEQLAQQPSQPQPTTATFYSVGSSAPVARGLRLGTRIIFTLAAALAAAPQLSQHPLATFCTLSPVPGFMLWLQGLAQGPAGPREGLERTLSAQCSAGALEAARGAAPAAGGSALLALWQLLHTQQWWRHHPQQRPLAAAALQAYLLSARDGRGLPLCRVAAFHLGNGARLGRVCGGADPSATGTARSGGFMVNYVYSQSGAEGLQRTQQAQAAAFAESPGRALELMQPSTVWEGEEEAPAQRTQ